MTFNIRTVDFAPDDSAGVSTLEKEEDLETYLDGFSDEDLDAESTDETPTSESEPSEKEPTSETEPVSSDSAETQAQEPSEQEPTSGEEVSDEPAKKLFADKYHSVEDLETAYRNQATETRRIQEKVNKLEQAQQTPEPESEPEPETKLDEGELSDEDKQINEIFYDKSPAEALRHFNTITQTAMQEKTAAKAIETYESEARDFNASLGQERLRELVVSAATKAELPEDKINSFKDENNLITEAILENFPAVDKQWRDEIKLIDAEFQTVPITHDGKVISDNGKFRKDAFKKAHILLNHEKIVADTHLSASEKTVKAIKDAKPTAKIMTPTEESHAKIEEPKWSGTETQAAANRKAGDMSEEAVESELDEWGE